MRGEYTGKTRSMTQPGAPAHPTRKNTHSDRKPGMGSAKPFPKSPKAGLKRGGAGAANWGKMKERAILRLEFAHADAVHRQGCRPLR